MSLTVTLVVMLLAAAVFVWARWHAQRERPLGEVTLVPHTLLQMIALIVVVVAAAHLISLLTGHALPGRGVPGRS